MWKLPDQDLEALISEFERSTWREMRLRMGGFELILSKDAAPVYRETQSLGTASERRAPAAQPESNTPVERASAPARPQPVVPPGWTQVRAPTLGTFYRSPKPGSAPFVNIGDEVDASTEMCLVEVMKLFTTVRAGVSGIVREVYQQDGDLVEFDQPLFLVEPRG